MTRRIRRIGIYVALGLLVLFAVVPFLWTLSTAFKPKIETFAIPTYWIPAKPTLDAFVSVWTEQPVWRQLVNSLIVAIVTCIAATSLATLAGYGVSRFPFKGQLVFLRILLISQMFPGVVLILPYYMMMRSVGLVNTYPALILAYTSFALPLAAWMMRGYMTSVPTDLDDAAMVDGCSRLQALVKVVLPAAMPGVVAVIIITFKLAWAEYLMALVLVSDRSMQVVTVGIASLLLQYGIEWNQLMALGVIALAPIVVLFVILERYLVAGLTAGAVKG
jgi:multiple sugar transport system permease protein